LVQNLGVGKKIGHAYLWRVSRCMVKHTVLR